MGGLIDPVWRRYAARAALASCVGLVAGLAGCGGAEVAEHPGKKTYERYCFTCHQAGVAGAPKYGDAETWGPRLAKSREALLASVIDGMPPAMPAGGLCSTCDEVRLGEALDYLMESVVTPD